MKFMHVMLIVAVLVVGSELVNAAEKLCQINPCQNYGICSIDKNHKAKCNCLKQYSGPFCEYKIEVKEGVESSAPACKKCLNGASCVVEADGLPNCTCTASFTGIYCEIQKSPCDPNPCNNNGFCISDTKNKSFSCVCATDYTGKFCETLNVCAENPCINGGYCVNLGDSYTCSCPSEYFGQDCEKKNPCHLKPCSANGICIGNVEDESFDCVCSPGFTGKTCNETDPCSLSPCKNDGICRTYRTSQETTYKCICLDPYTGTHCESVIDKCIDVFETCSQLDSLCPIIGLVCRKTCSRC